MSVAPIRMLPAIGDRADEQLEAHPARDLAHRDAPEQRLEAGALVVRDDGAGATIEVEGAVTVKFPGG